MIEKFNIAGYCRISVDEELDRDNTSIENQKAIISDFVSKKFPQSTFTFYEDRDRSGYTFEQREGYQKMRPMLMSHNYDILIVKDFSRFSRRNSKGLVELEDLRDNGLRIISIGDSIDYPTYDDWTAIQFRFLINEMPVTDTSKKVKSVIKRRQNDGKWICAVPYGYVITNSKNMTFEVDREASEIVKKIFELYNDGWGYKKIANQLTQLNIPTPRMLTKMRKDEAGQENNIKAYKDWSIVTIQTILDNDFYIGTLRQGKYTRKKINGSDIKKDETEHIIFENNHEAIIDYRIFATAQEQRKKRTTSNYRGVKKHDNIYSGFLFCGDCGSAMFSMSRSDLKPAYTCGTYHKRGLAGCTSHHIRCDLLDRLLKQYINKVKENSSDMLKNLNQSLKNETIEIKNNEETMSVLSRQLGDAYEELKATKRQRIRDIMKHPDREEILEQTYDELEAELEEKISGLKNQIELTQNKRNTIIQINRIARTAIDIFDEILEKEKLDKVDLNLIIEKIVVWEDKLEIYLKSDIDNILECGEMEKIVNFNHGIINIKYNLITQKSKNRLDKAYDVNVISNGDPLEIFTDNNGDVIFKKYSPIGELSSFATHYCDALFKASGHAAAICDRDHVISVAGVPKKELLERRVAPSLDELMEQRKNYTYTSDTEAHVLPVEGTDRKALVINSIIGGGDVCGAVMFFCDDTPEAASNSDIKLIQTAAVFLGKQMEE